jgi:hypothetical protein
MRRARINKKPQAVAARLRCRQRKQALPLDPRDPDVVRAKDLNCPGFGLCWRIRPSWSL